MLNIDFATIKLNLKNTIVEIWQNHIKDNIKKEICGFGLILDGNTISISTNEYSYTNSKTDLKDMKNVLIFLDHKFNPMKWKNQIKTKDLDFINELLKTLNSNVKEKSKFKRNIFKLIVEILFELKSEQLFFDQKEDFILIFYVDDWNLPNEILDYNKKYNSKIIVNEYEQLLECLDEMWLSSKSYVYNENYISSNYVSKIQDEEEEKGDEDLYLKRRILKK